MDTENCIQLDNYDICWRLDIEKSLFQSYASSNLARAIMLRSLVYRAHSILEKDN